MISDSTRARVALTLYLATTVVAVAAPEVALAEDAPKPKALLSEAEELEWASRVLGPDESGKSENNCKECHTLEYDAWAQSQHFATFKERHRSDRAKEILSNLGERSMKRSSECRQCHYTPIAPEGSGAVDVAAGTKPARKDRISVKWGVSCESCHSPARGWVDVHNRISGDPAGDVLKWGEGRKSSSEQRAKRIEAAQKKGMIHPGMLYALASNCVGCHTVPREQLVNKGDHKPGSEFELASWSQGEVRHNFLSSPGAPDASTNQPAPPERLRQLFLVGALVDLEYSARNLEAIKEAGGVYHEAMVERVLRLRQRLAQVGKAVAVPGLAEIVQAIPESLSVDSPLPKGLADKAGSAARAVADSYDGSSLGALDALIPGEAKGDPFDKAR